MGLVQVWWLRRLDWNDVAVDLGPLVGDTADGGRDLVFVSYSHHDAEWALRLEVLLKPLVRRKQLRLWIDTDIRVGDEWYPGIIRAIEQNSVALLLVSADYLNSDFIMEQELPTLIQQGGEQQRKVIAGSVPLIADTPQHRQTQEPPRTLPDDRSGSGGQGWRARGCEALRRSHHSDSQGLARPGCSGELGASVSFAGGRHETRTFTIPP